MDRTLVHEGDTDTMKTLDTLFATTTHASELDVRNVVAVVAVDRTWATAALVHADPLGNLYPFQWGTAFVADSSDASPHALIADAVERAWSNMAAKGAPRYARCLLCTPPDLTKGREAVGRIRVESRRDPGAAPRVTPADLADLRETVCTQNVSGSFTAMDLVPHAYADDTGHRVPDPLNLVTGSIELRAHVVMTETAALTATLDALRRMRVRVHNLVSPFRAAVTHIPTGAREREAMVIELADRDVLAASVKNGLLTGTAGAETGTRDIVRAAARHLGTRAEHLADWLEEHDALAVHGNDTTPLVCDPPPGKPAPMTLGELRRLLAEAATPTARTVIESLRRSVARPNGPSASWVVSDDRFAGPALAAALSACTGTTVEAIHPGGIHAADRVHAPGLARIAGCVRGWRAADQTALPVLEEYYRNRQAARPTRRANRRSAMRTVARATQSLGDLVRAVQALLF
jgi:hypothetical protein